MPETDVNSQTEMTPGQEPAKATKAVATRKRGHSKKRARRVIVKPAANKAVDVGTVEMADVVEEPMQTKHNVTAPWKPVRLLELPRNLKRPGMRARWVRNVRANTLKKESEGWEYVRVLPQHKHGLPKTIQDSVGVDGTIQVREMILMWMPEEMAVSRNKYYTDKANRAFTESKQRLNNDMAADSGDSRVKAYGTITEQKEFRRI